MMNNKRIDSMQVEFLPSSESEAIRLPRLDVAALFAGRHELQLVYGNEEYRLRITRNNKLILTK